MKFKSILKPQDSVISGIATAGLVYAIYNGALGSVASAHASDANHSALESSRKKSAYTAFAAVSAITLLTRDANIGVLGYGTIIALEFQYRHAIMADPATGIMQPPAETTYQAAENVVPLNAQGYSVG
jgi:hypothetical protein